MNLLAIITPSKSQFDEKVSEILSRPEYIQFNGKYKSLIQRIRESIEKLLEGILKKLNFNASKAISISEKLSVIFLIIALILLVAIIIFIVLKVKRTLDKKLRVKEILGEHIDEKTTPTSLRNRAMEFQREGDYRNAIRFDFIALLLLMHEQGVVYLDETKTNEEIYRYLMKNSFSKLAHFEGMIKMFNHSWYGHKQYDTEGYKSWNGNLRLVWNEVIGNEKKNQ